MVCRENVIMGRQRVCKKNERQTDRHNVDQDGQFEVVVLPYPWTAYRPKSGATGAPTSSTGPGTPTTSCTAHRLRALSRFP